MNVPTTEGLAAEERVTLVKPGAEKDVTYLTTAGAIRFVEGRAHDVPLAVARELAGPGWSIEPPVTLQRTDEGITK